MARKQDDPCPHCKTGKLSVHPDTKVQIEEKGSVSHRTWLCDNPECGKTCRDFERGNIETVSIGEEVLSATKGVETSINENTDVREIK